MYFGICSQRVEPSFNYVEILKANKLRLFHFLSYLGKRYLLRLLTPEWSLCTPRLKWGAQKRTWQVRRGGGRQSRKISRESSHLILWDHRILVTISPFQSRYMHTEYSRETCTFRNYLWNSIIVSSHSVRVNNWEVIRNPQWKFHHCWGQCLLWKGLPIWLHIKGGVEKCAKGNNFWVYFLHCFDLLTIIT